MSQFRTDSHNNPTAFITDIAKEANLVLGVDYEQGDPFNVGSTILHTARLLGNPLDLTIKVIDTIGFYNAAKRPRWTYIAITYAIWKQMTRSQKAFVIGVMYQNEGGTEMTNLFPKVFNQ